VAGALSGALFAALVQREIHAAAALAGALAGALLSWRASARREETTARVPVPEVPISRGRERLILRTLVLWCLVQLVLPLRHFLIPGRVSWTAEGRRFAWHMKLDDRDGQLLFHVVDAEGGARVTIDARAVLAPWQRAPLYGRPDMIRQYARHLAEEARRARGEDVEVRVEARLALNDRPAQLLIDPEVDLARAPAARGLRPVAWILPLRVGR